MQEWSPCMTPPPSPLELSKCKTRRFTAHLAYIATPTQRIAISIWIDASCPANIKHSNLQLPIKRQFCGSAKNTKVDSKGMGLQETTNKMNHLSDTPVAINFVWLWWSLTASEALSYGLIFQIFLGEHAPDAPTMLHAMRTTPTPYSMYAPHLPFLSISGSAPAQSSKW